MTAVARSRRRDRPLGALACFAFALALMIFAGSARAASTANTALINADSVTTSNGITDSASNPISLEQFAAQNAGYSVTVVSGAAWDAMTAADFAQYQVLIIGDPFCGGTAASANSNASTWAPVVMGTSVSSTAGNRVLVGTDPEDHYSAGGGGAAPTNPADPTTSGAEHLVQDGITFAGGVPGATGVYYDTSCHDPGTDIGVLDQLTTTGAGNWTDSGSPPCGGNVQQIASVPGFNSGPTKLTDSDIQGWGCSVHITYPTFPADWNPLAVATDTATAPTCGTDPDTGTTACGQAYVLVAGEGVTAASPNLTLTPAHGTDYVGATHTVTATVTQSDRTTPAVGSTVTFAVTGQNAGASGTCTTTSGAADPGCTSDDTGAVRFTYVDAKGAGNDTINASFTTSGGQTQHATATETWAGSPPPPPPPPAVVTAANRAPVICGSARSFRIHVQHVHRYGIVGADVYVSGKRVGVRHQGHGFSALVNLRTLPQARYSVLIVARSKSGKVRRYTRRYYTCTARLASDGHPML